MDIFGARAVFIEMWFYRFNFHSIWLLLASSCLFKTTWHNLRSLFPLKSKSCLIVFIHSMRQSFAESFQSALQELWPIHKRLNDYCSCVVWVCARGYLLPLRCWWVKACRYILSILNFSTARSFNHRQFPVYFGHQIEFIWIFTIAQIVWALSFINVYIFMQSNAIAATVADAAIHIRYFSVNSDICPSCLLL